MQRRGRESGTKKIRVIGNRCVNCYVNCHVICYVHYCYRDNIGLADPPPFPKSHSRSIAFYIKSVYIYISSEHSVRNHFPGLLPHTPFRQTETTSRSRTSKQKGGGAEESHQRDSTDGVCGGGALEDGNRARGRGAGRGAVLAASSGGGAGTSARLSATGDGGEGGVGPGVGEASGGGYARGGGLGQGAWAVGDGQGCRAADGVGLASHCEGRGCRAVGCEGADDLGDGDGRNVGGCGGVCGRVRVFSLACGELCCAGGIFSLVGLEASSEGSTAVYGGRSRDSWVSGIRDRGRPCRGSGGDGGRERVVAETICVVGCTGGMVCLVGSSARVVLYSALISSGSWGISRSELSRGDGGKAEESSDGVLHIVKDVDLKV